jgi:hypothetical protein
MGQWLAENWFNLFSSVGIIGGLWFTAVSLHSETKTRRVANLLSVTANHREIWKVFLNDKQLARIRDVSADTRKQPITEAERIFVGLVIPPYQHRVFCDKGSIGCQIRGMATRHRTIPFVADSTRSVGKNQGPPKRRFCRIRGIVPELEIKRLVFQQPKFFDFRFRLMPVSARRDLSFGIK